jgi:cellulose synthase/poly-beta-1,6-N-acetylglucosamine synthase-like glycosyltransferase
MLVSIIIPTFNGGGRIADCLDALLKETTKTDAEILVVNDGSRDNTADVVARYPGIRLVTQYHAGPAAARNRGALEARGAIILFTDDDCVAKPGWLGAMINPFKDPNVVGVKGVYRTQQKELIARFVQIEYENKYRLMSHARSIDFIDTYSAGFRRDRFLEVNGYDTSFPVACAEDVELSYRMSTRGWIMKFVPEAIVYHTHPNTLWSYLKKKYKFAFWRVLAVRKHPIKAVRDSHTPQLMKLQLLFMPTLLLALAFDLIRPKTSSMLIVCIAFLLSTLPFAWRAATRDPVVGLLSPLLLAARACAQILGVTGGLISAWRTPPRPEPNLPLET